MSMARYAPAVVVLAALLTACTDEPSRPAAVGGDPAVATTRAHPCAPLLNGRGFAGYLLLAESEAAGSGTDRWLCGFVEAKYRNNTSDPVRVRQVIYYRSTNSFVEDTAASEPAPLRAGELETALPAT